MTWDEDLLVELKNRGVCFVLIGSLAARWQGVPLDLTDIDILISTERENVKKLSAALSKLGFRRDGAEWTWGMKPGDVPETVGRQPITVFLRSDNEVLEELDVMTYMAGVGGYESVVASGKTIQIGGISVTVAAVEMIKRSKETLNRPKDQDHLAAISRWEQGQGLLPQAQQKGKLGPGRMRL
jgi:hypothetical protein